LGADPYQTEGAAILSYLEGLDPGDAFASEIPASIAAVFPNSQFDVLESFTAKANAQFYDFNYSDFAGVGHLDLSEIALVPEAASATLVSAGGLLLLRRRPGKGRRF
jgi:hypothetical protein